MSTGQNGAYISRRLPIHPGGARAALDAWHQGLSNIAAAPQVVRFGCGLWTSTHSERRSLDPQLLGAVRGVLWFRVRPIRVWLEITEWSPSQCEAAIRPLGLAWPVLTEGYARRIGQLLDGIVASLVAPDLGTALDAQRALVASPRSAPGQSVA
jgi:hypothetical protein